MKLEASSWVSYFFNWKLFNFLDEEDDYRCYIMSRQKIIQFVQFIFSTISGNRKEICKTRKKHSIN